MTGLTLIIGNKNYSSWSLRPWMFMKENNIDFVEKRVPLFSATTRAELAEYGSDSKVPVLRDGGLVIWDSLSILEHLSEKYLASRGWPNNERERALARSISAEMHSSFVNVRKELPMNCRKKFRDIALSAAAQQEITRVKALWTKCRTEFGVNGDWLFGEYSIADAMYAPMALRFEGYGISLGPLERSYVQHVLCQPSIQEWIRAAKLEKETIDVNEIEA